MDERKLRTFLTAVRMGSFTKAAEELNFSQSAVSQIIGSLENELECKLVERKYNGIELTPIGHELYPSIVQAETGLTHLRNLSIQLRQNANAQIRIGCFSSVSNTWLPHILLAYQKKHPEVTFDIRIGFRELEKWLLDGDIDLVIADTELSPVLSWHPLFDEPYYVVMPSEFVSAEKISISQDELSKYPFIRVPSQLLPKYQKYISKKQVNVSGDDDHTLLAMIAQGLGISIMPELCLHTLPENVRILELQPSLTRTLGVSISDSSGQESVDFYEYLKLYATKMGNPTFVGSTFRGVC